MADQIFTRHEEWRAIPGFDNYQASSLGCIRRATPERRYPAGHQLRPYRMGNYVGVDLRQDGRRLKTYVHRLVAMTFHGLAPGPNHEVAHLDGDKTNNSAKNLEWVTHARNEADKLRHGTANRFRASGQDHSRAKLSDNDVRTIQRLAAEGLSTEDLRRMFGVHGSTIRRAVTGVRKMAE